MRGWAIQVLQEAGAIRECEEHGWMQDRADPHARERAFNIAREDPPAGISPDAAAAEVRDVLYSIGDTCPELDEGKWDGIYLGRRKGDDLIYAGKVDHGFDKASAADLQKRLKPLIRKTQPYAKRIAHRGIWVEPKLLAEIEYRAKSAEGKVRHPFFRGLREDL
jgi:hypothetical protein